MTSTSSSASSGYPSSQACSPSPSVSSPPARKSSAASSPPCDDVAVDPAIRFASDLRAFERSLLQAIAAGGRLAESTSVAHAHFDLAGSVGHQIFARLLDAQAKLGGALTDTAESHRFATVLGRSLGLDVTADEYGPGHKPPSPRGLFFGTAPTAPIDA